MARFGSALVAATLLGGTMFVADVASSQTGASSPNEVDLKAAYCLEFADRALEQMEDPAYQSKVAPLAADREFSYIPAMVTAKIAQAKDLHSRMSSYFDARVPSVDSAGLSAAKQSADADLKTLGFDRGLVCEHLSWLPSR